MSGPAESLRLAPWRLDAGRFWSAYEVLAQYAWLFAIMAGSLEQARCRLIDAAEHENRRVLDRDDPILVQLRSDMGSLRRTCQHMNDMRRIIPQLDRFEKTIENGAATVALLGELRSLHELLLDDLNGEKFLYVEPNLAAHYEQAEAFGQRVSLKFPKCAEDIAEAGNCLALERNTAAVFHLMRVMESAVRRFGKRLGVSIKDPKRETWYNLLTAIDSAIKKLPCKTPREIKRQRRFAAASSALNNVRIACRNDVMHPKATYDRHEAKAVYDGVRLFMADLAEAI